MILAYVDVERTRQGHLRKVGGGISYIFLFLL